MVEHERPDERRRAISRTLKVRGQRLTIGRERPSPVVAQTMVRRNDAAQDARMRGQGQRHGRLGVGEVDSALLQRKEGRRVAVDVIGARRVEGDEEDAQLALLGGFAGNQKEEEQEEEETTKGRLSWFR